jgi:hypothetical protein
MFSLVGEVFAVDIIKINANGKNLHGCTGAFAFH